MACKKTASLIRSELRPIIIEANEDGDRNKDPFSTPILPVH